MARSFGKYSPRVSLAIDWFEELQLFGDEAETQPIDITGFAVRAQLRPTNRPVIVSGVVPNPLLEITTEGFYDSPPAWPVIEGFTVTDAANGVIELDVDEHDLLTKVSPTNARVRLYWEILLVNPDTAEKQPVVRGKPAFIPATTI